MGNKAGGKSIAALIFGILGLFCFGVIFGIIAIILAVMGKNEDGSNSAATIGLILGVIDVLCWLIVLIFFWGAILTIIAGGGISYP